MEYTDKDLFRKALGYYTSNADEVIDDIWENDDWEDVIIWEPFEHYEIDDLHSMVTALQDDFIEIRDNK